MTSTRLRDGATAALTLIEIGPDAVRCTRCGAQEHQPCREVASGRHHRERLWETRNSVLATLRTALGRDPFTSAPRQLTTEQS